MVALRRTLYRCGVRVRGVAGATDAQGLQQPSLSAATFRQNPVLLNRLRPWLRRELTVLYGPHDSLVDLVQRAILARITYYGLDAPIVTDELRPFLLTRTEHFLHELVSFARSPLSMENYDLQAVYEPPPEPDWVDSSSGSSSSIISISEEEELEEYTPQDEEEPEVTLNEGSADDVIPSSLSLSGWDDETPGPSYSTAEPSCSHALSPTPQQPSNQESAGCSEEEECLIVGYKKPIAERTPELVQLSSDSEEEPAPPTAEAPPTVPPSTSGAFMEQVDGRSSQTRPWSASTLSPGEEQYNGRRKKRRRRERRSALCLSSSSESEAPPTPTNSLWRGSSPCLSSFSSSSSPFLRLSPVTPPLLPPLAPPTNSGGGGDALRGEKPGGKRKYKSRHLDGNERERLRKGRRQRRPRPQQREKRSPSVEIIYEGTAHKHKQHRRKRQRRKEHNSSPVIITLDSDSNHDDHVSPLQPIGDFSDLPPLPLDHSANVGGVLSSGVCDFPMEILDGCDEWAELTGGEHTVIQPNRDQQVKGPIRTVDSDLVGGDSSLEDDNGQSDVSLIGQLLQSAPRSEEVMQVGGVEPREGGLSPKHTSCWSEDKVPLPGHAHWDTALPVCSSSADHLSDTCLPHTAP